MTKRWVLGSNLVLGFAAALAAAAHATAEGAAPEKAAAREPARMGVAEITACMRANVTDRGSLREIGLESVDRVGSSRALRMKLFWKPAAEGAPPRTMLRVVEPADYAGASYLAISKPEGDEVYVYMPALGRVQRVKGGQDGALFGTDFSWDDIEQLQAFAQSSGTKRLADQKVLGRPAFVLETADQAQAGAYSRIRSYVDQATCTLLRSEFFLGGDEPAKVLEGELSTLIEVEPWWLILGYRMENLRTGTTTHLQLSDVFLRETLPEALFDPARFHQVEP